MTHAPLSAIADAPLWRIDWETADDSDAVDALVLRAFGPGRFAKTAERLREGRTPSAAFVIRSQDRVIGAVRLWPIRIGETSALFLGPIAVEAESRREGMGAALIEACLEAAKEVGVLLVGDPPYFGRFGFGPVRNVRLQGPVDPRRVLWRGPGCPTGSVRPA